MITLDSLRTNLRVPLLVALATATLLAAGCGGGGGGGGNGGGGNSTPTVSLAVQPTTILLGQTATLTWSSDAGTTCTAGNAWTGTQAATGTQVVTPVAAGTLTYTLSCTGGT